MEEKTTVCILCLERIPNSKENQENLKKHMTTVHSADCLNETLAMMCLDAERREEREGLRLGDIIEEERMRREAKEKKRAESKGLINHFRRKKELEDLVIGNMEKVLIKCFICQMNMENGTKSLEKHLEDYHKMFFGVKEVLKRNKHEEQENSEEEETYL